MTLDTGQETFFVYVQADSIIGGSAWETMPWRAVQSGLEGRESSLTKAETLLHSTAETRHRARPPGMALDDGPVGQRGCQCAAVPPPFACNASYTEIAVPSSW